jgi:hypothetical protein
MSRTNLQSEAKTNQMQDKILAIQLTSLPYGKDDWNELVASGWP